MVERERVTAWLADYVAAWRSNDGQQIRALFTEDAVYRYHPYDEPVVGAAAIAADWLEDPDDPDVWEASYEPVAVDGDTAIAVGTSAYRATDGRPARTYHNCYVMRFAPNGRCREFTEWFMKAPGPAEPAEPVSELRLVVTASDYDEALHFYRDVLGMREREAYATDGARVAILEAGRATLELANPAQAEFIDQVEVGQRVAGHIRVALQVADSSATADALVAAGAHLIAPPTLTPWNDLNARLDAPAGLQLTLFTPAQGTSA